MVVSARGLGFLLLRQFGDEKIEGEKCMELFVMAGEAERVSTITKDFQTNKKMDTVKLVTL